jgi:LDH2 family malate/lactate/ureidoglycolate dehydrogenase
MMKIGASKADAFCVATNPVTSNLRGVDSHGVGRLQRYAAGIRIGDMLPEAEPVVEKEGLVMANINAMNGLWQPAAVFARRRQLNGRRILELGSL